MKTKNDLNYVVFNDFSTELLNNNFNGEDKEAILFIKSIYKSTSGGKGLYNYYKNQFFDANHNILVGNSFIINGISCVIIKDDYWGNLNGTNSMWIKVLIKDRLGVEIEKNFSMGYKCENRFMSLFNYLSFLDQVDTHNACKVLMNKKNEIEWLKKEISRLKS